MDVLKRLLPGDKLDAIRLSAAKWYMTHNGVLRCNFATIKHFASLTVASQIFAVQVLCQQQIL